MIRIAEPMAEEVGDKARNMKYYCDIQEAEQFGKIFSRIEGTVVTCFDSHIFHIKS
jgi:hypothetical protein